MFTIQQNPRRERVTSAAPAERILRWLAWADKDYVAARQLLLNAYLTQGTALGNTALEKYFKALLTFVGKQNPRNHDIVEMQKSLLTYFPKLKEVVDVDFLRLLQKAYRLRYPDNLEVGFSISLIQPKLLTELDRSVHQIRRGFRFSYWQGTLIESMIENNDPDLVDCNCYFSSARSSEVFDKLTNCYEMRVVAQDTIFEVCYQAQIPDDRNFPLEGLLPSAREIASR